MSNEYVNYVQQAFVANLKSFRKAKGLSQIELAQGSGLSQGYVADLERGKKFPSPTTIEKLSDALAVRPYQFFVTKEDLVGVDRSGIAVEYLESIRRQVDHQITEAIDAFLVRPNDFDK